MIPLLARRYIYRYLLLAFVLPIVARLSLTAGMRIERRKGRRTVVSRVLTGLGRFSRKRVEKAARKGAVDDKAVARARN
ncbi:hypothetical protein [Williamsia sp.]|uniref:hypothetical protein n=1 Tax=Williamsia sp. TaxID=1872085 RepID=UPI001A24285D|nr:hypothetical protein [Williamsia sp.]MBJ7289305.1 hypothetical protein [Williamsia sp.]